MKNIRDDKAFLTSKVARRIFTMFVLCAILPLLTISAVSFFFVGYQLENEAEKRLQQLCRNKGFQIYERLLTLESELKTVARLHAMNRLENIDHQAYNAQNREGSGLSRVYLQFADGRIQPILGFSDRRPRRPGAELPFPENARTMIDAYSGDERYPHLRMLRRMDTDKLSGAVFVGEIDPLYLWGIGTKDALPPEIDMAVMMPPKRILISSIHDHRIDTDFLEAYQEASFSGRFENEQNEEPYVNRYWSLFLKHRFSSPDWTIIFSQSKASIMAPVSKFRYIFFLLTLLTFWIILLISIRAIRKRTVPIETLKQGAMNIAAGEFGHQVDIQSGDEFENLAVTFNEMSSQLQQSQAMLLQSAKMSTFGQMGAGIVHEIGQPLSAISGYAQLMQAGASPEKHGHYVSVICKETERLRTIISKFRSFSRVSEEVFSPLSVNAVIDKSHELLDHQLRINAVVLEKHMDNKLSPIRGDANALQQVVLNLINNAIDALEEKPDDDRRVTVKTSSDNSQICIEISDNGCGIPEDIQSSVFNPFFTTKGEEKGTGLGLSIISSIIHKHNGEIELISKVGKGTCFKLSFPVYQKENAGDDSGAETDESG